MSPAAIDEVIRSVVVMEDKLINRLRAVDDFVDKRLAEQVAIGSFRLIGDGDANAPHFAFVDVVRAKEEVVFSVLLNDGRRPHSASRPFDLVVRENSLVLRPGNEIGGGEAIEISLLVEG